VLYSNADSLLYPGTGNHVVVNDIEFSESYIQKAVKDLNLHTKLSSSDDFFWIKHGFPPEYPAHTRFTDGSGDIGQLYQRCLLSSFCYQFSLEQYLIF